MCGICYCYSENNNASDVVIQQFNNQRERGLKGFGFVADTPRPKYVRATDEKSIIEKLRHLKSKEVLFHHRLPTSTDNVFNACHPFRIKGSNGNVYYVIHNGVIWNDDELKEKHDKLGIKYISIQPDGRFNDSEALAIELVRYLSGDVKKLEVEGSIAFICKEYKDNKPINLYFARNQSSPLKFRKNKNGVIQISSEQKGKSTSVPVNLLHKLNYRSGKITTKKLDLDYYDKTFKRYSKASYSDYDYYDSLGLSYEGSASGYKSYNDSRWYSRNRTGDLESAYSLGYDDGVDDIGLSIDELAKKIVEADAKLDMLYFKDKVKFSEIEDAEFELNYYQGCLNGRKYARAVNGL